jgi:hypothetical protein
MGSTGGPERLLLAGCSDGGAGALFNLDYASAWVPPNVQVHGLLDGALSVDIVPIAGKGTMPLQEQTLALLRLTNATGRLWPACQEAYPGADVAWKCLYGQYRLPFVRTAYLLAQPQYERVQLRGDEGAPPPYRAGTPAAAYAQAFGALVQKQAALLPLGSQSGSAVFAPACAAGCLTADAALFSVRGRGAPACGRGAPALRCELPRCAARPAARGVAAADGGGRGRRRGAGHDAV